jgi:hypothetical protein
MQAEIGQNRSIFPKWSNQTPVNRYIRYNRLRRLARAVRQLASKDVQEDACRPQPQSTRSPWRPHSLPLLLGRKV